MMSNQAERGRHFLEQERKMFMSSRNKDLLITCVVCRNTPTDGKEEQAHEQYQAYDDDANHLDE